MKKSDLKTGMTVLLEKKEKLLILKDCGDLDGNDGDTTCNTKQKVCNNVLRYWDFFPLSKWNEDLTSNCDIDFMDIIEVRSIYGKLLWRREPEKTFELDGISYSESTLRSIIKKASN